MNLKILIAIILLSIGITIYANATYTMLNDILQTIIIDLHILGL